MKELNKNFNGLTKLSQWWKDVKSNFTILEENAAVVEANFDDVNASLSQKANTATVTAGLNTKADKQTAEGGFAGGSGATVERDGAAVGSGAKVLKDSDGKYGRGLAGGYNAKANNGGSGGSLASTHNGGSAGQNAYSDDGGAVGSGAKTSHGFAGGLDAKCENNSGAIDAIQLGTGTNDSAKTVQAYDYRLMHSNGTIPDARIPKLAEKADKYGHGGGFEAGKWASAITGGAVGEFAKTNSGGAAGEGAETYSGGAIGYCAITSEGFAGGYSAMCKNNGEAIDAVQIGTGTNETEKTLQVYDYRLMNADGTVPDERIPKITELSKKTDVRIFDHQEYNTRIADCDDIGAHLLYNYDDRPWAIADFPEEEGSGIVFVYSRGGASKELTKTLICESGKIYTGYEYGGNIEWTEASADKADKSSIGELSTLNTADKSNIVSAINEVSGGMASALKIYDHTEPDVRPQDCTETGIHLWHNFEEYPPHELGWPWYDTGGILLVINVGGFLCRYAFTNDFYRIYALKRDGTWAEFATEDRVAALEARIAALEAKG